MWFRQISWMHSGLSWPKFIIHYVQKSSVYVVACEGRLTSAKWQQVQKTCSWRTRKGSSQWGIRSARAILTKRILYDGIENLGITCAFWRVNLVVETSISQISESGTLKSDISRFEISQFENKPQYLTIIGVSYITFAGHVTVKFWILKELLKPLTWVKKSMIWQDPSFLK